MRCGAGGFVRAFAPLSIERSRDKPPARLDREAQPLLPRPPRHEARPVLEHPQPRLQQRLVHPVRQLAVLSSIRDENVVAVRTPCIRVRVRCVVLCCVSGYNLYGRTRKESQQNTQGTARAKRQVWATHPVGT